MRPSFRKGFGGRREIRGGMREEGSFLSLHRLNVIGKPSKTGGSRKRLTGFAWGVYVLWRDFRLQKAVGNLVCGVDPLGTGRKLLLYMFH